MKDFENMWRPWVYIAGPYTNHDPVANTREAADVFDVLMSWGNCWPFTPHAYNMLLHFHEPRTWDDWMEYDLGLLTRFDVILRLPGFSKGADKEVEYAKRNGIEIFYDITKLKEWLDKAYQG